jgi:hypothetical protein
MLLTNWFSVFYWISVMDNVRKFLDVGSNIFTSIAVVFLAALFITKVTEACYHNDSYCDKSARNSCNVLSKWLKKPSMLFLVLSILFWSAYIFCPSKKDGYAIIAGGIIGNFIESDSSIKQIPSEITNLLRQKIREETSEDSTHRKN